MPINASRPNALSRWLAVTRNAWIFSLSGIVISLSFIGIAVFLSLQPQTTEKIIGYVGMALQLGGVVTSILGIFDIRASFRRPKEVLIVTSGGLVMGGTFSGYGTYAGGETIESVNEALQKNATLTHERISQTQDEMNERFRKAADALKNEEQSRQAEAIKIATGGAHISFIGASWTIAGMILSTAANDIVEKLLK